MKNSVYSKLPVVALWICSFVTLFISVWFLIAYFNQPEGGESTEISAILFWILILFIITVSTGLVFLIIYYIRQWKENPRKVLTFLSISFTCGLLLTIAFILGNGNPLNLTGYQGSENTYIWLKITDMWLYTIYFLLGLGFLALIGGIIWSYFKKLD